MNTSSKILHTKTETQLAAYQTRQFGNTCTFHIISVGLQLLINHTIDPMALSEEINRLWWRGHFMRVAPDWAVTPRMQMRIVKYLAQSRSLPITATYQRGDPETLPELLTDLTSIPIITLLWPWRKAPPIFFGNTTHNFNSSRSAGGHSMLFAAYDPNHSADNQFFTPWGFINPWKDNAKELFWMRDEDFRRAWRFWLPGISPNPVVMIQRTM